MDNRTLYFNDNFFSSGKTVIYDENKTQVGELDLKSAFSSSVDVLNQTGSISVSGKFRTLRNRWVVTDYHQNELGELRQRFAFFSKKYEYNAGERGVYEIKSEAFSRQYEIFDSQSKLVAKFERVSGFFSSAAYRLSSYEESMPALEWIVVVMGVNAIIKRNNSAAANSGGAT